MPIIFFSIAGFLCGWILCNNGFFIPNGAFKFFVPALLMGICEEWFIIIAVRRYKYMAFLDKLRISGERFPFFSTMFPIGAYAAYRYKIVFGG